MLGDKSLRDGLNRLSALHHDRYRRLLTGVADVPMRDEAAALWPEPFRFQQRCSLADQSITHLHEDGLMLLLQRYRNATLEIIANIGIAHAERTQDARKARHEHILTARQTSDTGRMKSTRSAAGYEGEPSRVEALFDADVLNGMQHRLLGKTYDAGGSFDWLEA